MRLAVAGGEGLERVGFSVPVVEVGTCIEMSCWDVSAAYLDYIAYFDYICQVDEPL